MASGERRHSPAAHQDGQDDVLERWPAQEGASLIAGANAMSAPQIDYNKLRADALVYASDQMRAAAEVLAEELMLREGSEEVIRKHPTQVFAVALLAHLDERAEERRRVMEAGIAVLQKIADAIANGKAGDDAK
jgi:hypothetical protein